MTRPLDDEEFESIGKPKEWGVLPIRPIPLLQFVLLRIEDY